MMPEQLPLNFEQAAAKRDDGIARAIDHAEAVDSSWPEDAFAALARYCETSTGPFLSEDMREAAHNSGLAAPPDRRAWGAIVKRAAREGLIVKAGAEPARSSNLGLKQLWESAR